VTIDWTVKKSVRAKLRVMVKRIGILVIAMPALLVVGLAVAVQAHNQGRLRE
jgi:hypothetical protein